MHDSVKAGLCNQLTLEHVVPVRDWQLTCKDCCLSVISVIYDLLKIVLQLPFQPDHAKVVYDKQVMCVELAEEVGLSSFEMYEFEVFDEHVHSEVEHLDSIAVRPLTQCTGIVGLSCFGRTYDDEGHGIGDVFYIPQIRRYAHHDTKEKRICIVSKNGSHPKISCSSLFESLPIQFSPVDTVRLARFFFSCIIASMRSSKVFCVMKRCTCTFLC